MKKEHIIFDEIHSAPDITVEEDGGHFNKNKDNQPRFTTTEELPEAPQATLENHLDVGLNTEIKHSPSGWYLVTYMLLLNQFKNSE